jgi:curved DNA-binding protein CbpA
VPPRIPILNRGIDVFSLPLSTKEGFVLSRVDDVSTVEDISIMVGIKVAELLTMLERLADLGAVKLAWRPAVGTHKSHSHKAASGSEPAPVLHKGEAHPAVQRVLATPVVPLYAEHEVDEPGDLSEVQKRRVLNAFYGVQGKDFYQLLGVDQDVDKKAIRAAYFEISRLFHPDSLFGKDLGSFKVKMETVFKRVTEAYEVLGRSQRRKEYDEYLASTMTTSAIQHTLDRVESQVRALSSAPPQVPNAPAAPVRKTMIPQAHEDPRREKPSGNPRGGLVESRVPGHDPRAIDDNEQRSSVAGPRVEEPRARLSGQRPAVVVEEPGRTRASGQRPAAVVEERSANASVRPPVSGNERVASGGPRAAVSVEERAPSGTPRPAVSVEERKAHARERLRRNFAAGPAYGPGTPPNSAAASAHGAAAPAHSPAAPMRSPLPATIAARVSERPPAAAPPTAAGERRDSVLKGLRQSLRQSAAGSTGVEPVLAHLRRAKEAELVGDLLGAAAALQAALTLEPNHKDIQTQYERVSKAVTRSLADNYEKQAQYEEKQTKWGAAALSWERVSEGRPEDAAAARAAADALLKSAGDLAKAQRFAQRAVDAAPSDAANVVVLARVFLAAGQRVHARRELEKAVKLDPQNEMIKNLLREAR